MSQTLSASSSCPYHFRIDRCPNIFLSWYLLLCRVPVTQQGSLLFLKQKFQLFDFTNEDSGARCWGESLLAQRGRESTQLTFLLSQHPRTNPLPPAFSRKLLQTECLSLLLLVHLSVHPCDSLLLCMFLS